MKEGEQARIDEQIDWGKTLIEKGVKDKSVVSEKNI